MPCFPTVTHNHFTALWTLSGTTQVRCYQKIHFGIFWIFWCKMKITQADTPTIRTDCHPIKTNWCPHLCHLHHTRWHGCIPIDLIEFVTVFPTVINFQYFISACSILGTAFSASMMSEHQEEHLAKKRIEW